MGYFEFCYVPKQEEASRISLHCRTNKYEKDVQGQELRTVSNDVSLPR